MRGTTLLVLGLLTTPLALGALADDAAATERPVVFKGGSYGKPGIFGQNCVGVGWAVEGDLDSPGLPKVQAPYVTGQCPPPGNTASVDAEVQAGPLYQRIKKGV